ncbi:hypothetical protein DIPPA_30713 [Diplonema papillatum]|nr:hypothetical protein DIPPA_30713 [Diplonema papillatum]
MADVALVADVAIDTTDQPASIAAVLAVADAAGFSADDSVVALVADDADNPDLAVVAVGPHPAHPSSDDDATSDDATTDRATQWRYVPSAPTPHGMRKVLGYRSCSGELHLGPDYSESERLSLDGSVFQLRDLFYESSGRRRVHVPQHGTVPWVRRLLRRRRRGYVLRD